MANLKSWSPEDPAAWESGGSRTAWRNLAVSVPSLLVAFSVWMFWSILTVRMKEAGFPFSDAQLFTLISISGLVGATLRIPSSFMVAVAGGRNTIAVTTALMILPALGAGLALQDAHTSFATFAALAALSGIGGGNFASSMGNIPAFWPKRLAGTALGLNGGLGNLGVSVMQFLIPLVMGSAMFGALAGAPLVTAAGKSVFVQNGAMVWVPVCAVLALAAWFFMDNLPGQDAEPTWAAVLRILGLHILGFVAAGLGILGLLVWKPGLAGQVLIMLVTVLAALGLLKLLRGKVKQRMDVQFVIFKNPHTWTLTFLYFGTFGSFIGLSGALPLLIKIVFGRLPGGAPNPLGPNPLAYAWMGAFVGSVARPIGGWLADRWGGARLTQVSAVLMIAGTLGVAHFLGLAQGSPAPQDQFMPFLLCFLLVFVATGLGNGAVFQMAPVTVGAASAGPTVGWISAVAAYGSFIIPGVFKTTVESGGAQRALYGFALFYLACFLVNGWTYLGWRPAGRLAEKSS
jgi:MFS transporter, NNP family, nitrate/nitrite transporter